MIVNMDLTLLSVQTLVAKIEKVVKLSVTLDFTSPFFTDHLITLNGLNIFFRIGIF